MSEYDNLKAKVKAVAAKDETAAKTYFVTNWKPFTAGALFMLIAALAVHHFVG